MPVHSTTTVCAGTFIFMVVSKINYQRTFNLHNYSSERIGVECDLFHNEDVNIALDNAKKMVEEWHTANHPELYQDKTPDIPVIGKQLKGGLETEVVRYDVSKQPFKEESLEEQINSCKSPTVLKAVYEKIVKGKPELETAYNQKLKELT
jgi:hypothetical protein